MWTRTGRATERPARRERSSTRRFRTNGFLSVADGMMFAAREPSCRGSCDSGDRDRESYRSHKLSIVFDLERRLTANVAREREELRRLVRDGLIDLIPAPRPGSMSPRARSSRSSFSRDRPPRDSPATEPFRRVRPFLGCVADEARQPRRKG
jgi:hypothetical protein